MFSFILSSLFVSLTTSIVTDYDDEISNIRNARRLRRQNNNNQYINLCNTNLASERLTSSNCEQFVTSGTVCTFDRCKLEFDFCITKPCGGSNPQFICSSANDDDNGWTQITTTATRGDENCMRQEDSVPISFVMTLNLAPNVRIVFDLRRQTSSTEEEMIITQSKLLSDTAASLNVSISDIETFDIRTHSENTSVIDIEVVIKASTQRTYEEVATHINTRLSSAIVNVNPNIIQSIIIPDSPIALIPNITTTITIIDTENSPTVNNDYILFSLIISITFLTFVTICMFIISVVIIVVYKHRQSSPSATNSINSNNPNPLIKPPPLPNWIIAYDGNDFIDFNKDDEWPPATILHIVN